MTARSAALAAAAAGLASGILHSGVLPWSVGYSDVVHLFPEALAPGIPYLERPVEYPVLLGLFMRATGWLGGGVRGYYLLTVLAFSAASAACAALLSKEAAARRVFSRWCLAPSLAILLVYNWDILAVACVLGALVLARRERAAPAGTLLAAGFCFKLYPVLYLAPLAVAWRRKPRLIAAALAAFVGVAAAVNLPFARLNFDGWSYCFAFNFARERLPNPDSIWSVLRFVFGAPGGAAAGTLSSVALAALLALVLWRLRAAAHERLWFGATLALLLASKFFSPQYALWLLPFFVLADAPDGWSYGFEAANLGALFAVLSWLLVSRSRAAYEVCAVFVVLRHMALAGLLGRVLSRR